MAKYQSQYGAGGTQYAYYHDEDETSFQLVDTAKNTKPMYGRGRGFRGRGGFRGRWNSMNKPVANAPLQTLTKAQKIKERDRMRQAKKWQKQQAGRMCRIGIGGSMCGDGFGRRGRRRSVLRLAMEYQSSRSSSHGPRSRN